MKALVFLSFLAGSVAVRQSRAHDSWPSYLPIPNSGRPPLRSIASGPKQHLQVRFGPQVVAERVLRLLGGWRRGVRERYQLRNLDAPEIADWLKTLGMSEYAERFAENGIDISVLRHLTDQDLKDMGVLLGHRRKMLAVIAELRGKPVAPAPGGTPAVPGPTSAVTVTRTIAPAPETAGERRYLTVMFCDLVGSTAISVQLDPEEWRDLVSSYLDA